jgi:hypothetical protein
VSAFVSKWNGIALTLAIGLIHLIGVPEHFEVASYLGWLFVANFLGSVVAAFGIYRGGQWGWLLGALIASASFLLFLFSRTVGLPATHQELVGHWSTFGIASLIVEALFVALYLSVTGSRR